MINISQPTLALAEGFGLALSPCILPVLPFLLAASISKNRTRPLEITLGFIISFTVFSLIARQILVLTGIQQDQIQAGAFALLLLFGLVMLIPKLEEKFAELTSGIANRATTLSNLDLTHKAGGGFLVGALIGLVWTPCAGPILAVALLQVIQSKTDLDAIITIAAFGIGAGLPMLAIGYFSQALTRYVRALTRHSTSIRRAMGTLIVLFAVLGLSGFNLGEWVVSRAAAAEQKSVQGNMLRDTLAQPYAAPEISGITKWFNSTPLDTASLKGKVVLVDFWTYSCINCIRTLPYIKAWYEKYKDQGLVVIGVHAPEFAFEGQPENVEKAIQKFGITYPVAMDNDLATWQNFANRYWPAHYLINRNGKVVYTHFGEGNYDTTEGNIRALLGIAGDAKLDAGKNVTAEGQTPETYLGNARKEREATSVNGLPLHHWAPNGSWKREAENIESAGSSAALTLHYHAKKVFLVMESADGMPKSVTLSNGKIRNISVKDSQLYELVENPEAQDGTVTITSENPGLRLFAFTFEG